MTEEERDLLVQYLCMALPYGVMLYIEEVDKDKSYDEKLGTIGLNHGNCVYINGLCIDNNGCDSHAIIKPYLRSLSSMTAEEKDELSKKYYWNFDYDNLYIRYHRQGCWEDDEDLVCGFNEHTELQKWLNAHHLDYKGLIKKGLAIEAPKNMYKI